MIAVAIAFWLSLALIAYTHLGYPLVLRVLVLMKRARPGGRPGRARAEHPPVDPLPAVSLIVAAYDEEEVIEAKLANALALDYPADRLQTIVASDGSSDGTVARARAAGADLVLDLPRGGKLAAQNAAAERASGEILAFSDANAAWAPDALRRLVAPFADPAVGYACGRVSFLDARRRQPRGRLLALRDGGAGDGVGPGRGDRRATGRSTRFAAAPTFRCRPRAATTSPSPSCSRSAACAPSTCRTPPRRRRWCRRWRASSRANDG